MRYHQRKNMEKQVTHMLTCFDKHFMNEQIKIIITGGCDCNGNLNPINQKGECKHQASTGCGLWLTSQFLTVIYFIFEKCRCVLYKCGQVLC